MSLIISIIMIVPCMHEIHQNAIKHSSLCCSLYAIQCLVDMQLVETSLTLPDRFFIFFVMAEKGSGDIVSIDFCDVLITTN